MLALTPVQNAQASTYLEGAVNAIIRKRPVMGMLDADKRVNRNFEGKDWNWLLEYRALEAEPYTPFQQFDFYDINYHLPLAVQPVFWAIPSAMDITEIQMNTGRSALVKLYNDRMRKCAEGMEIQTAKAMYNDVNSSSAGQGSAYMTGLRTFAHRSHVQFAAPTYVDRMAAPDETVLYGGKSIGLGQNGGTWSNDLPTAQQLNQKIGYDWPDGTADDSQRFDVTCPRLYNDNSNQWTNLGAAGAAATWQTNCVMMISRANTDLRKVSTDQMAPNMHISGSGRYQAILDAMRSSFRYTMAPNGQAAHLGYPDVIEFEGGGLVLDAACPANFTFSLCSKSVDVSFYGAGPVGEAMAAAQGDTASNVVTGGIYAMLGPVRDPRGLSWLWLMYAGGQIRWNPRYITIHGDWINNV